MKTGRSGNCNCSRRMILKIERCWINFAWVIVVVGQEICRQRLHIRNEHVCNSGWRYFQSAVLEINHNHEQNCGQMKIREYLRTLEMGIRISAAGWSVEAAQNVDLYPRKLSPWSDPLAEATRIVRAQQFVEIFSNKLTAGTIVARFFIQNAGSK